MKIWVIKFTNKHESFHATRESLGDALAYIAENSKALYDEEPDNYWEDCQDLDWSDGQHILDNWSSLSGETEYYEVIETELGGGFTSAS